MIREAIAALVSGDSLDMEMASAVMAEIMEGEVTPAQLGAFLTALRIKGETTDEIAGLAKVMRARAVPVMTDEPVIDVVGTGGDNANTFNISTAAALVAAGAGIKVAKHGNRAMSSRCGSADVLEALGVRIDLTAEQVQRCLREVGMGFMFAPSFHPAMKYAAAARREIGVRTVFNILGPLTNPARAEYQVIGVPDEALGEKIALALRQLDIKRALVVYGLNGIDEISITDSSRMWELGREGIINNFYVAPEDFGFNRAPAHELGGGTPEENATMLRRVLDGERTPRRDVVLMNAAAAMVVGGRVTSLQQGVALAGEIIDSGKARGKLEKLIAYSQSLGREA